MRYLCSRSRAAAPLILVVLILSAIVFSGCEKTVTETEYVEVPGACGRLYSWKSVWPPLTSNSYYAVYGLSESDVFVVGDFGNDRPLRRHELVARRPRASPAASATSGSSSATSGYAVGDVGAYKYDGTSWSPLFNTGSNYYSCVWGSGEDDVWCGTTSNHFSHWNGTSWATVTLPSYNYFQDMWGTGPNDIYAVGQSGTTNLATVWHYDGASWSDVTPPGLTNAVFYSVWGTASNNVYVVGDGSTIRRWNGSSWGTMSTTGLPASDTFRAIRGRSATDIYVATYGAIYHFTGSSWAAMDMSSLEMYPYIHDLWIGPTRLFVAGEGGMVVSYDGDEWRSENGGPWKQLQDVWTGGPNEAVAVGWDGVILEYDGTTVTDVTPAGFSYNLAGIAGSSGSLYAVGSGGRVLHYDGSSWSDITDTGVTTNMLSDVWASGNEAFAVGSGGTIVRISGTTLAIMTSGTTEELYGVWGSSTSDVFAVGEAGTILHYNGSAWTPMDSGGFDDYHHQRDGERAERRVRDVLERIHAPLRRLVVAAACRVRSGLRRPGSGCPAPKDLLGFSYNMIYHFDGAIWIAFPHHDEYDAERHRGERAVERIRRRILQHDPALWTVKASRNDKERRPMNLTGRWPAYHGRVSLRGMRGSCMRGALRLRRGEASRASRARGRSRRPRSPSARRRRGRFSVSSKDEGDAVAAGDTLARYRRREARAPAAAAPRERRRDTGEPEARRRDGAAGGG